MTPSLRHLGLSSGPDRSSTLPLMLKTTKLWLTTRTTSFQSPMLSTFLRESPLSASFSFLRRCCRRPKRSSSPRAAHGSAAAGDACFIVDAAVVAALGVEVGLVAADPERLWIQQLRAELDAGVALRRGELVLEVQLEISRLAALPDEEGLLRILLDFMTTDGAVLDGPEIFEAFPAGQVLAVEDRDEAVRVGLRLFRPGPTTETVLLQ